MDTDHDALQTMTDIALRDLLTTLAKQCGEIMSSSVLKIQHRNVLIAAIIDRRNTIDQAMGSIVSRQLVLSDDSDDDSSEYTASDASMSDHANTTSDSANGYDTHEEPDIDGYYADMPADLATQLDVSGSANMKDGSFHEDFIVDPDDHNMSPNLPATVTTNPDKNTKDSALSTVPALESTLPANAPTSSNLNDTSALPTNPN